MKAAWEQLHHLPVFTSSGEKLGVVEGVTIDTDTHAIDRYEVKRLFSKKLLIAPSQVLSITEDKMIVDDAVVPAQAVLEKKQAPFAPVQAIKPEIQTSESEPF